ncbi:transposase, fragment [Lactobacillus plantarum WCFS1] [Lactiplantibacillus mudanjiangensis]|nr:transposase, fragment [Lactobacillus plantarum WCFS1] [Lactiplantibacillus mudanjiangensis]
MGINGSRYTIAEKFYYIELVNQGEINSNSIQRMYGITGLKH